VGHTDGVESVAYSPDGQHIISGSYDNTIRIWDAETGAPVGDPLVGHTYGVRSVAYSPDGQHIISGSGHGTIRIWNAETGAPVGKPLVGHISGVRSVAHSPDGKNIISGSSDHITHVCESFPHICNQLSSSTLIHSEFYSKPHPDGWVRDSQGGLLYWVPPECRVGLHSPALLIIPRTSRVRSVLLDFEDCAIGTSWTQIFKSAQP
jgi:WD40 repeat protein